MIIRKVISSKLVVYTLNVSYVWIRLSRLSWLDNRVNGKIIDRVLKNIVNHLNLHWYRCYLHKCSEIFGLCCFYYDIRAHLCCRRPIDKSSSRQFSSPRAPKLPSSICLSPFLLFACPFPSNSAQTPSLSFNLRVSTSFTLPQSFPS